MKDLEKKNKEILDKYISNGLIDRCIDCQFARFKKNKNVFQFKEDLKSDLYLELLEYEKLEDIDLQNRFNAFFTRCIVSNLYSNTSWFYRRYLKHNDLNNDIEDLMGDEEYEE